MVAQNSFIILTREGCFCLHKDYLLHSSKWLSYLHFETQEQFIIKPSGPIGTYLENLSALYLQGYLVVNLINILRL